ncbi:uncharacterized protein LOC134228449 [Saccostrea cucullata]|uniref:uncharacterized protein LOC134228449 n=1 Tax=Saccostrea cuccullata TaxID=36930 RepID=UPI002ED6630C
METVNQRGRPYVKGKALSKDMRSLIINDLIQGGAVKGNPTIPRGLGVELSRKFKVSKSTVSNLWKKYNEKFSVSPRKPFHASTRKIGEEDCEFIKVLKTEQPSMQLKTIKNELLRHSNSITHVGIGTISNTIRKDLNMTYKKMCLYHKNRFNIHNLQYTQRFLNYVANKDPYTLKFMDEMGIRLVDGQPNYGHSIKGTRCVEMTRYDRTANYTVSLIVGITGVKYVSIIDGPSDTFKYVGFIGEAANSFTDEGERAFQLGDTLVIDNAPIHHHTAERILRNWLPTIGVDVLFLPTYSPDLNPAEKCFLKVKTLIKSDRYVTALHKDMKEAVLQAFGEITMADTLSFFHATDCIFA